MCETAFDLINQSYRIPESDKYGICRKHLNPLRIVLKNLLLVLKAKTNQIKQRSYTKVTDLFFPLHYRLRNTFGNDKSLE